MYQIKKHLRGKPCKCLIIGDPGVARTLDPLIKSQLLYQLSYEVFLTRCKYKNFLRHQPRRLLKLNKCPDLVVHVRTARTARGIIKVQPVLAVVFMVVKLPYALVAEQLDDCLLHNFEFGFISAV